VSDSPSGPDKKAKGQAINRDLIRDLADLLDETRLSEIEIEQNGMRVRVARQASGVEIGVPAPAPRPMPQSDPAGVPHADAPQGDPSDWAHHPGVVTSPMVGTAYVAPEPGAPAFVKVGD
jgi:acetyl-CoA carboxylase biotin carboxyl carrier protein